MISDFAVFSAICIMVFVDVIVGLDTEKLQVPDKFEASYWFCWLQFCYANPHDILLIGSCDKLLLSYIFFKYGESPDVSSGVGNRRT